MSPPHPILSAHQGTRVVLDGRELTIFAGTDYLGLARDPRVVEALVEGARRFGISCSASRITSGNTAPHVELETALAAFLGVERVALTCAGFLAAAAAVEALGPAARASWWIDAESHASLVHALESPGLRRYPHLDPSALGESAGPGGWHLATDAVFGLRGERAPLDALAERVRADGGLLLVDDCHALGVTGPGGRGTPPALRDLDERLVVVGTLSKALGAHGGYVAGSAALIDRLECESATYLGATPPPPAVCRAARRALQVLESEPERVARLHDAARRMRAGLRAAGLPARGDEDLPVFALERADGIEPAQWHEALLARGFLVPCSRYPGAPTGGLLRWTLQATHTDDQIDRLIATLTELAGDRSP